MPLSLAPVGSEVQIKVIKGRDETRRFLENLGFLAGTPVTVITDLGGNLIVHVKESRVAISRSMANRILI